MNTLANSTWEQELERRCEAALRERQVKLFLAELPAPPDPMPSSQYIGMAICCGLIGALVATALFLSLH